MLLATFHALMLIVVNVSETYGRLLGRKSGPDNGALQPREVVCAKKEHRLHRYPPCENSCTLDSAPCQSAECLCFTVKGKIPSDILSENGSGPSSASTSSVSSKSHSIKEEMELLAEVLSQGYFDIDSDLTNLLDYTFREMAPRSCHRNREGTCSVHRDRPSCLKAQGCNWIEEVIPKTECKDIANGATDVYGDGCDYYDEHPAACGSFDIYMSQTDLSLCGNFPWCGFNWWDECGERLERKRKYIAQKKIGMNAVRPAQLFDSMKMCCACGGGRAGGGRGEGGELEVRRTPKFICSDTSAKVPCADGATDCLEPCNCYGVDAFSTQEFYVCDTTEYCCDKAHGCDDERQGCKVKHVSRVTIPSNGDMDEAELDLPTCDSIQNLEEKCGDNEPVDDPNEVECETRPCSEKDLARCCQSPNCGSFDCGAFDRIDSPSRVRCHGFPRCGDSMIEHEIRDENPSYESIAAKFGSWVTAESIRSLNNNAALAQNERIKIAPDDMEVCCKVGNEDPHGYNRGNDVRCDRDAHCNPEGSSENDHTRYCDPARRVCVPRFRRNGQVNWKKLEHIFKVGIRRMEREARDEDVARHNPFLPTLIDEETQAIRGSSLYDFRTFSDWVKDDHKRELESLDFFQRYMELAAGVPVDNFNEIAGKGDDAGEACVDPDMPSCFGPLYCGTHSDDLISLWFESEENDKKLTGMSDETFDESRSNIRNLLTEGHETVAAYLKATPNSASTVRETYGQCGKIRDEIKLPGGQHIAYEVSDRSRPDLDPKFVNGRTSKKITEDTTYEDDGKRAIIILGPSAAGKTASTFLMLKTLSIQNGWYKEGHDCKPLKFYSADGGLVREASSTYWRWKRAVQFECGLNQDCVGASDFYNKITKKYQKEFLKNRLIPYLVKRGKNIIFPTTATDGKTGDMLNMLNANGYSVSVVMVYAPLAQTLKNARGVDLDGRIDLRSAREVDEGKKYSTWGYGPGLHKGWAVFEYARKHNIGLGNKFAVLDNSKYSRSTSQKMGLGDDDMDGSIGKTWDAATEKVRFRCPASTCFTSRSVSEVVIRPRKHPIDMSEREGRYSQQIAVAENAKCK